MNTYEAVVHSIAAFVIARRHLQAPDWSRSWTPPTMTQTHSTYSWTPPMGRVQLKLFYFISWWNHAWNKIMLGPSTNGGGSGLKYFISAWNHVW